MIAGPAVNVNGRIMLAVLVIVFGSILLNWYQLSGSETLSEICWIKICFMHWGCTDYTDSSFCSAHIDCLWDNENESCTYSIF